MSGDGNMRKISTFRKDNSGQLLIVAALVIALLISSTTVYVYELGKETEVADTQRLDDFFFAIKRATHNAMISSLANVSNGGDSAILTTDLNELAEILRTANQFAVCNLTATPLNDSTYNSGVWLSWNTLGLGVTSAYSDFSLKAYTTETSVESSYAINVTTEIMVSGFYTELNSAEKLVNLTAVIHDETGPALAQNMSIQYENAGEWITVDSSNLSITDYGNSTYSMLFIVSTASGTIPVSAQISDLRNIYVRANTTCPST
jgi:hypothetical protein